MPNEVDKIALLRTGLLAVWIVGLWVLVVYFLRGGSIYLLDGTVIRGRLSIVATLVLVAAALGPTLAALSAACRHRRSRSR